MKGSPCFVCGKPTRVETWTHYHTGEVISVVERCRACSATKVKSEA